MEAVVAAKHDLMEDDANPVYDKEIRLLSRYVLQRDVSPVIPTLAVLVMQYRMTMEKCAASRILSGNSHRITFLK